MTMKFLTLTFLSFVTTIASATAADITITVQGVRNDAGKIAALAFVKADGFPDRVALAKAQSQVNAQKGAVTLVLKNVPEGKVALTILHDEDGDGKLKRNIVGIPQEGVGMTGKPLGNRAPKFEDAVTEINGNQKIDITLKYW
jgi:uncharacterized protein (DUF2141 family)